MQGMEHKSQVRKVRQILTRQLPMSLQFFSACDTDGNGLVDRKEFRAAVMGMRGGLSDAACDEVFDEVDADRSGEISYDEYLFWMVRSELRKKAHHAMAVFREMDLDGTGEVEKWEFRRALASMGFSVPSVVPRGCNAATTTNMYDRIFDSMDQDGNGRLSFEELLYAMRCKPYPASKRPRAAAHRTQDATAGHGGGSRPAAVTGADAARSSPSHSPATQRSRRQQAQHQRAAEPTSSPSARRRHFDARYIDETLPPRMSIMRLPVRTDASDDEAHYHRQTTSLPLLRPSAERGGQLAASTTRRGEPTVSLPSLGLCDPPPQRSDARSLPLIRPPPMPRDDALPRPPMAGRLLRPPALAVPRPPAPAVPAAGPTALAAGGVDTDGR